MGRRAAVRDERCASGTLTGVGDRGRRIARRSQRLAAYQLRIQGAEVAHFHRHLPQDVVLADLSALPDILRFLQRPIVRSLLTHAQQFTWTVRRLLKRKSFTLPARYAVRERQEPAGRISGGGARLYVDVTSALRGTIGGGIQRMSLHLACEFARSGRATPVVLDDGTLKTAGFEGEIAEARSPAKGDTYLILDTFWEPYEEYRRSLAAAQARGARTALLVHDAIPFLYPGLNTHEYADRFDRMLSGLLPHLDVIVAVSKASARSIRRFVRTFDLPVKVCWFHLGADLPRPVAPFAQEPGRPTFLCVGTIEPKKGYDVVLDAFDQLWAGGSEARCTIVGREGWVCSAIVTRIRTHPELGRRLRWLDNASDDELNAQLAAAYCFIQASIAEGFGLPLVEAAAARLPIIASDLPVFKEIAGRGIVYFPVCDADALAARIQAAIETRPPPPRFRPLTWAESARLLADRLAALDEGRTAPRCMDAPDGSL